MAKILVASMPAVGHVGPLVPLVRKLVERGHEVRWYTSSTFRNRVESSGASYLPMRQAEERDAERLNEIFPERRNMASVSQLRFDIKHFFGDPAVGHVRDIQDALTEFDADLIFADSTFIAAAWVHELGGPPYAVYNPLPITMSSRDTAPFGLGLSPSTSTFGRLRNRVLQTLVTRVVFRDTTVHIDRLRTGLGLSATGTFVMDRPVSPFLNLQGTVPGFEYPRSDLPDTVHFIGPVLATATPDFAPPDWWEELSSGKPVVHVTQGTVATESSQLLVPTLKALADEDVLVVGTTGGAPVEDIPIDRLPGNARVERFIPHAHLLPHVDVMITNGGYNGVQMALSHGVPLVAAGMSEDKPEVCARISWSGTGVNLRTSTPDERALRDAVTRVLKNPRYRYRAADLASEFSRRDAPTHAADLIERLAETRQPIRQSTVHG